MIAAQGDIIVYIGREDCRECKEFEEVFADILEQYSVITPTYYINQDKDGENRKKLDEFLSLYDITSVPCIFLIRDGDVIKKWDDPVDYISEIETFL